MPRKRRANGEGSIFKRKDGLWVAEYTDKTGKTRTFYGRLQNEVTKKLKEAQKSDDEVSKDVRTVKFADWLKEWLEVYSKPVIRKSTYALYYGYIYGQLAPAFVP